MAARKRSQLLPAAPPVDHVDSKEHRRLLARGVRWLLQNALPQWRVPLDESFDLLPAEKGIGVGDEHYPVSHVAVGDIQNDPANNPGVEGVLTHRFDDPANGGALLAGYRLFDPNNPPAGPNRAVELWGQYVVLAAGSGYWMQVETAIPDDRHLILGPSQTLADGKLAAPILIGPEVVYTQTQTQLDIRNLAITDQVETAVVLMTLTAAYAAGRTSAHLMCLLTETTQQESWVEVRVYHNGVQQASWDVYLYDNKTLFTRSFPVPIALALNDTVEIRVFGASVPGSSNTRVRGDQIASEIRLVQA